jgi:hypothetical protein
MAFASAGKVSLRGDYALPFMRAVNDNLAENGFHDLDVDAGYEFLEENFAIPASFFSPHTSTPTAVFGADDLAIGVFLFLGPALGEWAIEKAESTPPPARVPFKLDIWFDGSKAGVTINTELSETTGDGLQVAIREALAGAAAWAAQNNSSGKRLSFDTNKQRAGRARMWRTLVPSVPRS